jgi:hypothetical protein
LRTQGLGYDRIATRLNDDSVPTRTGKSWNGVVVNRILTRIDRAEKTLPKTDSIWPEFGFPKPPNYDGEICASEATITVPGKGGATRAITVPPAM